MAASLAIVFDGTKHTLSFDGKSYTAYNNVDSSSAGKWPNGKYALERVRYDGLDSDDGSYGSVAKVQFQVAGRSGMQIHSGRMASAAKPANRGPAHPTMGCIRTTNEAVTALVAAIEAHGGDATLTVKSN